MQTRKLLRFAVPTLTILAFVSLFFLKPDSGKASESQETTYYLLTDHLGSIDVVLDEEGNVVERRDYLPYGSERLSDSQPDATTTDHKFTGKELDDETGLHYYGARYYDAESGRFVSVDPLVMDEAKHTRAVLLSILDDPQRLNAYSYALNNPVQFVDEYGESAEAMAGFGRMIDGAVKTFTAYLAGTIYPSAKIGATAMAVNGGSEVVSGFVLATTEQEPVVTEGVEDTTKALDILSLRKVPFIQKTLLKQTGDEGVFERDFRALGEFAEDAGELAGQVIRDIVNDVNAEQNVNADSEVSSQLNQSIDINSVFYPKSYEKYTCEENEE